MTESGMFEVELPPRGHALHVSFNADTDHLAGIGNVAFAGRDLFVHSVEGKEGPRALAEKRRPNFSPYRW